MCDRPLHSYSNSYERNDSKRYACYLPYCFSLGELDCRSETEHLTITINNDGTIHHYFAEIYSKNKTYYLQSYKEENKTFLYSLRYVDKESNIEQKGYQIFIPKFFNINVKESLSPQFSEIFEKINLYSYYM